MYLPKTVIGGESHASVFDLVELNEWMDGLLGCSPLEYELIFPYGVDTSRCERDQRE